jgi:hypothetical protein
VNDREQNGSLLTDVLGEGIATDVRDGLLHETLRLARRRRRFRQGRRAASALAVLIGLGLLAGRYLSQGPGSASLPIRPYTLVRTQPLPLADWIVTKPLSPAQLVVSASLDNIVVTAKAGMPVRELSDDELLALAPKPAALVRFGPHSAELVLVSTADRNELLRN